MQKLRVLWLEDADGWYSAKMPYLKSMAAGVGFDLIFERYRGNENLLHLKNGEQFDIALVDHKLRDKPNGEIVTGEILLNLFLDWGIAHALIYYSENPSDMKGFLGSENITCVPRSYVENTCMRCLDDWADEHDYRWNEDE